MHETPILRLPCDANAGRATIEAAVRDVLGAAAVDSSQPLMEAGLDSLGEQCTFPSRPADS